MSDPNAEPTDEQLDKLDAWAARVFGPICLCFQLPEFDMDGTRFTGRCKYCVAREEKDTE